MKFVLIVVASIYSGGAGVTAEFQTLGACESALEEIVADIRASEQYVFTADCYQKGR